MHPLALINNLRSTSALALVQSDATSTSRDSELLAKKILETAWLATHAPGSATALFAFVSAAHHRLTTCNMGDSGCIVLRPTPAAAAYSVVFRTQEQQHYFNCPYQLSSPETRVKFPGTLHDHPRLARASHFTLCPNGAFFSKMFMAGVVEVRLDIIVAATDGVFDNLFDSNITELAALQYGMLTTSFAILYPSFAAARLQLCPQVPNQASEPSSSLMRWCRLHRTLEITLRYFAFQGGITSQS